MASNLEIQFAQTSEIQTTVRSIIEMGSISCNSRLSLERVSEERRNQIVNGLSNSATALFTGVAGG